MAKAERNGFVLPFSADKLFKEPISQELFWKSQHNKVNAIRFEFVFSRLYCTQVHTERSGLLDEKTDIKTEESSPEVQENLNADTEKQPVTTEEPPKAAAEAVLAQDKEKQDAAKAKKKAKKRLKKAVRGLLIKILLIAVIIFSVWHWVGEVYILHTNAMYPHLKDGSLIVTYKLGKLMKDDVVLYEVFDYKEVGRIVGVPGDVINITDTGLFTVNEMTPYENVFYQTTIAEGSNVKYPLKLRPGEYFVLNDMRDTKEDSRIYGSITEYEIHGKVVFASQYRGI